MSSRSLVLFAMLLGAAALIVAACTAPAAPGPTATPTKAPALATSTPSAPTGAPSVERGQAVFEANCNGCHPNGNQGVGPNIRGKDVAVVKDKVRKGGGGMPPFSTSQISDQQLNDVAAYVNSLK